MKKKPNYETVSEALEKLKDRGYTYDFELQAANDCLYCHNNSMQLSPEEFQIDETHRFEGPTDPGDSMIVYAISSRLHDLKGVVVDAYGAYADADVTRIVSRLQKASKKPIRRNEALVSLSREHHHGLLLCWKIRTGLKFDTSPERIKTYAEWFFREHLLPHFEIEEKFLFPLAGDNEGVQKAIVEHRRLKELFSSDADAGVLRKIADELESHIRFEERVLFNDIQKSVPDAALKAFKDLHTDEKKFVDNFTDPFWEEKAKTTV